MQLLIKIAISLGVVITCLFLLYGQIMILRSVWSHDIDVQATVDRLKEKTVAGPEWLVTKDPNRIYQDGKPVGDVSGPVDDRDKNIHFAKLSETSAFRRDQPFEFRRLRLRMLHFDQEVGMDFNACDAGGSKILKDVLNGVRCEVLK